MTEDASFTSLRHQLLIAMPQLGDPHFHQSVTYLFEHGPDGAMGIIINRPLEATMHDLLGELGITSGADLSAHHVLYGGPVQGARGFVLHRSSDALPRWNHSATFPSGITLATSRDVLQAIADGKGPATSLVTLGYAGWGAGQLDREIAENSWLAAPADLDLVFEVPFAQRWSEAARRIGVDLSLISQEAGHG